MMVGDVTNPRPSGTMGERTPNVRARVAKAVPRGFSPKRLRALRARTGLTQAELATAAAVSTGSIQNWEAGKHGPDVAAARRLAEVLTATVADLIELPEDQRTLADLRTSTGQYQTEVAVKLGWSVATLAALERGDRPPHAAQRAELARAYAVKLAAVNAAVDRTAEHRAAVIAAKVANSH